jgi:hypothetical protein
LEACAIFWTSGTAGRESLLRTRRDAHGGRTPSGANNLQGYLSVRPRSQQKFARRSYPLSAREPDRIGQPAILVRAHCGSFGLFSVRRRQVTTLQRPTLIFPTDSSPPNSFRAQPKHRLACSLLRILPWRTHNLPSYRSTCFQYLDFHCMRHGV